MDQCKENGYKPAFSRSGFEHTNMADNARYAAEDGLTKREMFAMAAMQGMLSSSADRGSKAVAKNAIEFADELLKQLGS